MSILLIFSRKFQDKSYLIIFGFWFLLFTGVLVSILQLYAENQSLKTIFYGVLEQIIK